MPADLDKNAVRGAVMENCAIQISYRIKDPNTAEWLARSTGKIQIDDEMRDVTRNFAGAETVNPHRKIRQGESYFIDDTMFMSLPKGMAVVTGVQDLAAFCHISPITVEKRAQALDVTVAHAANIQPAPVQASKAKADDTDEDFL